MVPIAIGTQTGGSVIRPASYCGVAGFKPSYKLIPTMGVKTFSWSLDTLGLFAARVEDVAFAAAAIAGRNLDVDGEDAAAPRLALVRTHVWDEATPDARAALLAAARACEAAGATMVDLALPPVLEDAYRAHATIQDHEVARALAWEYDTHRGALPPLLGALLDAAQAVRPEDYDAARRTSRRARNALAETWADIDALLTLSAPGEAPATLASTGTSIFNRLWTLMGNPCVNVPGLRGASGLPIGVQVVGRFGRDRTALAAARFVERAINTD
jgi:Asp-tRNA(Asn)/Glu-tRNA(Gln) amidotransferase A subunit family amidase